SCAMTTGPGKGLQILDNLKQPTENKRQRPAARAAGLALTTRALAPPAAAGPPPDAHASYHDRRPRHRGKALAQALHTRVDLVGGPQVENQHVVVAAVDRLLEAARHLGAAAGREPALEHGELQPAAVTLHQLEHAPPAPVVRDVVGDDVEALFHHGRLPYEVVRIVVDLAAEMAREQACLHLEQAPHGHAIAEHGVGDLLSEAALVGGDEGAARVRLEVDGGPGDNEAVGLHLAVVDDLDH